MLAGKEELQRELLEKSNLHTTNKYFEACGLAQKIYLTQQEEYYNGKLIDHKGDARATYNVVNQLLDKCSERCNMSLFNHNHVK